MDAKRTSSVRLGNYSPIAAEGRVSYAEYVQHLWAQIPKRSKSTSVTSQIKYPFGKQRSKSSVLFLHRSKETYAINKNAHKQKTLSVLLPAH